MRGYAISFRKRTTSERPRRVDASIEQTLVLTADIDG